MDFCAQYLHGVSPAAEFLIVVVGAFGLLIFASIVETLRPSPDGTVRFSDDEARQLLVYALVAFSVLVVFLRLRGWALKRIGFAPDRSATIEGFGLGSVYLMTYVALWPVVIGTVPQVEEAMPRFSASELSLTVTVSLFNPLFEEAFVCGYVVSALRDRYGLWTSINVSAGIRLLYHLYQGGAGVLDIVPMGLIFGHWYAWRGNLWPLSLPTVARIFTICWSRVRAKPSHGPTLVGAGRRVYNRDRPEAADAFEHGCCRINRDSRGGCNARSMDPRPLAHAAGRPDAGLPGQAGARRSGKAAFDVSAPRLCWRSERPQEGARPCCGRSGLPAARWRLRGKL